MFDLSINAMPLPKVFICADGSDVSPYAEIALRARAGIDPAALASALREAVRAVDPSQPVADVTTVRQQVEEAGASRRFDTLLFGTFAALAFVLAVFGLYAVTAYLVAQRRASSAFASRSAPAAAPCSGSSCARPFRPPSAASSRARRVRDSHAAAAQHALRGRHARRGRFRLRLGPARARVGSRGGHPGPPRSAGRSRGSPAMRMMFLRHLLAWIRRPRLDDEMREELEQHVALEDRAADAEGLPTDEARRQAALAVGKIAQARPRLDDLAQRIDAGDLGRSRFARAASGDPARNGDARPPAREGL